MKHISRVAPIHTAWPEALVIYPQGLYTTEGRKPGSGWVSMSADKTSREIDFFDEMYNFISEKYDINPKMVYAMGHSNGGSMVSSLWIARPEKFAAIATSCSGGGRMRIPFPIAQRAQKPVFYVCALQDELVNPQVTLNAIEKTAALNRCEQKVEVSKDLYLYGSKEGNDVMAYIVNGTHRFYTESIFLMVSFFKEHVLK